MIKGTFQTLNLGDNFTVEVRIKNNYVIGSVCKFIKTTPKGYNFLNLETNKVIFGRGFYPAKSNGKFFIHKSISIVRL
jgi:hypothetical protein